MGNIMSALGKPDLKQETWSQVSVAKWLTRGSSIQRKERAMKRRAAVELLKYDPSSAPPLLLQQLYDHHQYSKMSHTASKRWPTNHLGEQFWCVNEGEGSTTLVLKDSNTSTTVKAWTMIISLPTVPIAAIATPTQSRPCIASCK
jgi:hypothetical protein